MEKKKFMTSLLGCIVLCGFAAMALASSSNKSVQDSYNDGYELGRALRQAISDNTTINEISDSIDVTGDNDVAMIDE